MPFRNILLRQSRERLAAFLKEIQRVSESEFPYEQSKASLDEFRTIFKNKLERLNQLDGESDPDIVRQECALASYALSLYLPMLGIVLRSTQVRNAFEVYRPLLRMARNVLDPNPVADADLIQLVLSSGWDYSPYIFPEIPELPGYALIEFPAPESANPLLLPLAGHELGHSLWIKGNLNDIFWPLIDTATRDYLTVHMDDFKRTCRLPDTTQAADLSTDTDTIDAYAQSESWLTSQAEESFCDFVGLKLFGTSYFEAFSYLVAPKLSSTRSEYYPNNESRVANLVTAANIFDIEIPPNYETLFENDVEPGYTDSDRFLQQVADESLRDLIPKLISKANELIVASNIALADPISIDKIIGCFKIGVPASGTNGLPDIINAAWKAYRDDAFWPAFPNAKRTKEDVLTDLVLKNIEIYEIEQLQKVSLEKE